MTVTDALSAVRFGTGLSPSIAPPADAAEILYRLGGPDRIAMDLPQPGWDIRVKDALDWIELRRTSRKGGEAEKEAFRAQVRRLAANFADDLTRAVARGAMTEDGFRERLAWFWADHFYVAESRGYLRKSVSGYHEDAIRPHVAGRFADLLQSAVTHPAMVAYLDQGRSAGPNSPRGRRGGGLNENLAREILELHTLGVGGPYTQTDVTELAELLTGLSITKEGARTFSPNLVEPGGETVLGQTYGTSRPNPDDITDVLNALAVHPVTAAHISRKLAVHFIADTPPDDLVDDMTRRWLDTDGDLMAVYAAMLDHPASWSETLLKVRRPFEYLVAATRAFDAGTMLDGVGIRVARQVFLNPMRLMGQNWQHALGPDGWPEEAEAWITPQALATRIEWAMQAPSRLPDLPDPRQFVETALGPLASPRTRFAADAAEDRAAGIGLILSSPEFQRR